jgi:hypothetical protein
VAAVIRIQDIDPHGFRSLECPRQRWQRTSALLDIDINLLSHENTVFEIRTVIIERLHAPDPRLDDLSLRAPFIASSETTSESMAENSPEATTIAAEVTPFGST